MADYQFRDCASNDYLYVLSGVTGGPLVTGSTYFVQSPSYSGCSTVVVYSGSGYTFDGSALTTITLQTSCDDCFSANSVCSVGKFCLFSNFIDTIAYDSEYALAGFYNGNYYYSATTSGVTGVTYYDGNKWCLSDSIGGGCVLFGSEPCYSNCPDLCEDVFFSGDCPTTTTTTTCSVNFDAIFDCTPTPTPCQICCICEPTDCDWQPYTGVSCVCVQTTGATVPDSATTYSAVSQTYFQYSEFGTLVYAPGYSIDGTGTTTSYLTGTTVWENTGNTSGSTITDGPLNRSGIWTTLTTGPDYLPLDTWIGYSFCVDIASAQTYYVGLGADNKFSFRLNGQTVVESVWSDTTSFKYWHVYPLTIPQGTNVIELFGLNSATEAGFGCEIYNNTIDELTGATVYGDLNVIYTTANQIGGIFDLVADSGFTLTTSGYTCPSGYVYQSCSGNCLSFTICDDAITPTPTPTPTSTPLPDLCSGTSMTITLTAITATTSTTTTSTTTIPTIGLTGTGVFELVNTIFICPDVTKKLESCSSGQIYYTVNPLITGTTYIESGQTFNAVFNGVYDCVTYLGDVQDISPNTIVTDITAVFCGCENCIPEPTTTTTTTTDCCP